MQSELLEQMELHLGDRAGPGQAVLLWYLRQQPWDLLARMTAQRPRRAALGAMVAPEEEHNERRRAQDNLAALRLLASGRTLGGADIPTLLRYSGWGGIHLQPLQAELGALPAELRPDPEALIHEFYTPSAIARAVADAVGPLLPGLAVGGSVLALEPAAGIGRFINAFQPYPQVRWQAVEMSPLAARVLSGLRPDVRVHQGSFESWVEQSGARMAGRIRLVVTNPPYGERGPSLVEDSDRSYREGLLRQRAYLYFMLRTLDLLPAGGLGVYLVPYGFLTGSADNYIALRDKVLRRHHLSSAYRLPSGIFPGANLVTDLLFFRSRGGSLTEHQPEDQAILQGRYFVEYPDHLLGREVGAQDGDDDQTRRARRGYEVRGTFTGLPPLVERPLCAACVVTPVSFPRPRPRPAPQTLAEAAPDSAPALGQRVAAYLALIARGSQDSMRLAHALHGELRQALLDLLAARGNPAFWLRPRGDADLQALLSAYPTGGGLLPALDEPPAYQERYQGGSEDVVAQAKYLHGQRRTLTAAALAAFHQARGGHQTEEQLRATLLSAGWCVDGTEGHLVPGDDYYTGNLWPKYDLARQLAAAGDAQQGVQAAQLIERIAPVSAADIGAQPRMGWIPLEALQPWAAQFVKAEGEVRLQRHDGLLQLAGKSYDALSGPGWRKDSNQFTGWERRLRTLIGYINHDLSLFQPENVKKRTNTDVDPPREETEAEALDRERRSYGDRAIESFAAFLADEQNQELRTLVTDAYNRLYRGFVLPTYSEEPLDLARWNPGCPMHGYQRAAVRRVVDNDGGLIAHDVGLGKTREGVAAVVMNRQLGRARRPVVLVQNGKVIDWLMEFACGAPDYRIGVIGAAPREMTRGSRKGEIVWDTDTPEARSQKWRRFQAGEFDAVLLTYSMLNRTRLQHHDVQPVLDRSSAVRMQMAMDARNMITALESSTRSELLLPAQGDSEEVLIRKEREREERARLRRLTAGLTGSERAQAVYAVAQQRFIAEQLQPAGDVRMDPGIDWAQLGVDLFVVDEAQNFKNLFTAQRREGGVPQFMGASGEGSDRAWQMFFRSQLVQATGGSVVLLSATPVKNSPLEIYTLLQYVQGDVWSQFQLVDPEQFIDRFLQTEMRLIQGSDLDIHNRLVVKGFQRLDELREIVFRYGDFKTAEDVGLQLPPKRVERIEVPMNASQDAKYEALLAEYERTLQNMHGEASAAARFKLLRLMTRMALVALHPALDDPPHEPDENGKRKGWQWDDWDLLSQEEMHAPKLEACAHRIAGMHGCGHIVFVENVVVHRWFKQVLIDAGVPEERIGILNAVAAKSLDKRQAIARAFNGDAENLPSLDVVICNQIAYEGINLQGYAGRDGLVPDELTARRYGTCAIHHLDLPWEPATLQQRNGRGDRQGNQADELRIFYYLTTRSTDMARFQMIDGKRSVQISLFKSMDRETNNPGAQAQMTPEELLVYISRHPERVRALLAERQQRRIEAAQAASRKEAWRNLRALALRVVELRRERQRDPAAATVLERQLVDIAAGLREVDPTIWPWAFFADAAVAGDAFLFSANGEPGCLVERGTVVSEARARPGTAPDSFMFGRIAQVNGQTVIGRRAFASAVWEPLAVDQVKEVFDRTRPSDWKSPWPEVEDRLQLDFTMRRQLESIAFDGAQRFREIHLELAPEAWRRWFWDTFGVPLVRALARDADNVAVLVPLEREGMLHLVRGPALREAENQVLPFTEEGYQRFLRLAPHSGLPPEQVSSSLRWWWGAVPPYDLMVRRQQPRTLAAAPLATVDADEQEAAAVEAVLAGISARDDSFTQATQPAGPQRAIRVSQVRPGARPAAPAGAPPAQAQDELSTLETVPLEQRAIRASQVRPGAGPAPAAAPAAAPAPPAQDGSWFSMLETDDREPSVAGVPEPQLGQRIALLDLAPDLPPIYDEPEPASRRMQNLTIDEVPPPVPAPPAPAAAPVAAAAPAAAPVAAPVAAAPAPVAAAPAPVAASAAAVTPAWISVEDEGTAFRDDLFDMALTAARERNIAVRELDPSIYTVRWSAGFIQFERIGPPGYSWVAFASKPEALSAFQALAAPPAPPPAVPPPVPAVPPPPVPPPPPAISPEEAARIAEAVARALGLVPRPA